MRRRQSVELIREGRYAAEIDIELAYSDEPWSPTMSLEDGLKLERVRSALRRGDLETISADARVFELLPLAG